MFLVEPFIKVALESQRKESFLEPSVKGFTWNPQEKFYRKPFYRVVVPPKTLSRGSIQNLLPICANKNSPSGFYQEPFSFPRVFSRTHQGGFTKNFFLYLEGLIYNTCDSTENLFIFQGFYLEHTKGIYQDLFNILRVLSKTHTGGSTDNVFIFQGFYLEHTQGVLPRTFLYYKVFI